MQHDYKLISSGAKAGYKKPCEVARIQSDSILNVDGII